MRIEEAESITENELTSYSSISPVFNVTGFFEIKSDAGPSRHITEKETGCDPNTKNYDETSGNHPTDWMELLLDASAVMFYAMEGTARKGAAILLNGWKESDISTAVLWDIRVEKSGRRSGIGKFLLQHALELAKMEDKTALVAETQNNNTSAC